MRNLLIISLLILSACAQSTFDFDYDNIVANFDLEKIVHVKVDSYFNPDFTYSSKKIYVFPNNASISMDNPWFKYYADFIYAAFSEKGFSRASHPQKAELGILLDFYVSQPIEQTKSYTRQSDDGTRELLAYNQKSNPYDLPIIKEKDGIREVWNYHTNTITSFLYKRYITIEGIDLIKYKESDGLMEDNSIFKMTFESIGNSNDLNKIFPILIASGKRYIGQSLEQPVWRKINFYSKELRDMVAFIQANNLFQDSTKYENLLDERYYMIPPTSRPRRLRLHEIPVYKSF